jgi:hypothetical protein
MPVQQYLGGSLGFTLGLLEHGELVCVDRFILVVRGFDMPAREIAAIAARKSSGSQAPYWNTLPVAVIDVARYACNTRILKRKPQSALPGGLWDVVASPADRSREKAERKCKDRYQRSLQCVSKASSVD